MIVLRKIWYYSIWVLVKIGLYFFYKKITVTGKENIPKNTPVIFAANHENAFIDAFLVATHNSKFCNFLVRADVFRFKIARFLFSTLNMQPVYRIRDGFNNLKSNDSVFKSCYQSFNEGESLIMFPEGTHDIRRIPRKITKGISRLALGAMNDQSGPEKLYIVPVGLDYSAHEKFRSSVQINFGQPILVQKQPMENKSFDDLRNKIQSGLEESHIGLAEKNYGLLHNLIIGIESDLKISDYKQVNKIGESINDCLKKEKEIGELTNQSTIFSQLYDYFNLSSPKTKGLMLNIILSILMVPFFLYGAFVNGLVLILIYFFDKVVIKDKTFIGSINFSIGLFLFPVLWVYQFAFFKEEISKSISSGFFLLSMPLFLIVFHIIRDFYGKVIGQIKFISNKEKGQAFMNCKKYLKAYKTRCLNG